MVKSYEKAKKTESIKKEYPPSQGELVNELAHTVNPKAYTKRDRENDIASDADFHTTIISQPDKKAKGGKVKSASARADGCAIRGKTRA